MSCFLVVAERPIPDDLLRGPAAFIHARSLPIAHHVLRSITPSAALVSRGVGEDETRKLLEELARRGVPTVVVHTDVAAGSPKAHRPIARCRGGSDV